MEALENLQRRNSLRYDQSILNPVIVNSVDDIKRVVAKFDPAFSPHSNVIPISTLIEGSDHDKTCTFVVSSDTRSRSQRDILLDGLGRIKERINIEDKLDGQAVEINGKTMKPAAVRAAINEYNWIDPLIKHWFGGYRDGIYICWDLGGYQYRYDLFRHKLTRIKNEDRDAASSAL